MVVVLWINKAMSSPNLALGVLQVNDWKAD